jgi:hypothetical protein
MRASPRLKTELADLGDDLDRRDLWLFGPLIAIVVAMPLAIVAITSVSLWFLANHSDLSTARSGPTTFASRWVEPKIPMVVLQ